MGWNLNHTFFQVLLTAGLCAIFCSRAGARLPEWISSPSITNWGEWGDIESCLEGHFVNAYQVKLQSYQGDNDDTALNGAMLHCAKFNYNDPRQSIAVPIPKKWE